MGAFSLIVVINLLNSVVMKYLFRKGLERLSWGVGAVPFDRFLCQVGAARVPHFPLVFLTRSELSEFTSRLYTIKQDLYIHDSRNICNVGDIVLARKIINQPTQSQSIPTFPQTFHSPADWDLVGREVW